MKAIVLKNYKTDPILDSNFSDPGLPNSDEVVVRMKAGSINPIDWKTMQGKVKMLIDYPLPIVLGNDGSGVIHELGSSVKDFKVGDEVYFRIGKPKVGTFAEKVIVKSTDVSLKPENISFEEAAGIPLAGLTAYQALFERAGITKGQKVFIAAGSGGVGSLAIQMAKIAGAYVASTCGTSNVELVKSLGADLVIDYRKENFEELLKDYDITFDTLGGGDTFKCFRILKKGGVNVSISNIPTPDTAAKYGKNFLIRGLFGLLNHKIFSSAKKFGIHYEYLFMNSSGSQLGLLKKYIEEGTLKPLVDTVYEMSEFRKAFDHQMTGRSKGKIVIRIS